MISVLNFFLNFSISFNQFLLISQSSSKKQIYLVLNLFEILIALFLAYGIPIFLYFINKKYLFLVFANFIVRCFFFEFSTITNFFFLFNFKLLILFRIVKNIDFSLAQTKKM